MDVWGLLSRSPRLSTMLFLTSTVCAAHRRWIRAFFLVVLRPSITRAERRKRAALEEGESIPIAEVVEAPPQEEEVMVPQVCLPTKEMPEWPPQMITSSASSRVVSLGADGCERLVSALRQQRSRSETADVEVVAGNERFSAHAAVLEAASPALAEAARSSTLLKDGRGKRVIEMCLGDGAPDARAVEAVLDFAYGGLVRLDESNVENILELSSKLQMAVLVDECCAFVAQRTSATRACRVLALADRHNCTLLRRDVALCVLRHFTEACGLFGEDDDDHQKQTKNDDNDEVKEDSFLEEKKRPAAEEARAGFLALPRHLLFEVLSDDRLFVCGDESLVFKAAVAWLEHRETLTQDDADAVLSLVRYYLIEAEILARTVEIHPLMQSAACRALVHAAYRYQAIGPRRLPKPCDYYDPNWRQRPPPDALPKHKESPVKESPAKGPETSVKGSSPRRASQENPFLAHDFSPPPRFDSKQTDDDDHSSSQEQLLDHHPTAFV